MQFRGDPGDALALEFRASRSWAEGWREPSPSPVVVIDAPATGG